MDDSLIYTAALDINLPWHINGVHFQSKNRTKNLSVQKAQSERSRFAHESVYCPFTYIQERLMKNLNFSLHECYIFDRIPNGKTANEAVKLLEVPFSMTQEDIVFARLHIAKKLNGAIEKIRRKGQSYRDELKESRYLMPRKTASLTICKHKRAEIFAEANPTVCQAYRLRRLFNQVMNEAIVQTDLYSLHNLKKFAEANSIEPNRHFVNMLRSHWHRVKTYFSKVADNAFAEQINLNNKEILRIAKGYWKINNFILMINFHIGSLNLQTQPK